MRSSIRRADLIALLREVEVLCLGHTMKRSCKADQHAGTNQRARRRSELGESGALFNAKGVAIKTSKALDTSFIAEMIDGSDALIARANAISGAV